MVKDKDAGDGRTAQQEQEVTTLKKMQTGETFDLDALARVADEAAEAAGVILLEYSGKARVEFKGEIDLVTDADREAEKRIIEVVRKHFPDHGIYAEESGERASDAGVRWLIDPIDGTTNYAHGFPLYAVSIGVEVDGQIVVGIVFNPAYGEKYTAIRGRGARLNGEPIRVSDTEVLDRSLLVTGFPYTVRTSEENNVDHFIHFTKRCQAVRRLGSAALDLAYVARGSLDGFWETHLNPWDMAAGWLLVEEAGGKVTDLRGNPLTYDAGQILASNGRIHEEMLDVLKLGKTGMESR